MDHECFDGVCGTVLVPEFLLKIAFWFGGFKYNIELLINQ